MNKYIPYMKVKFNKGLFLLTVILVLQFIFSVNIYALENTYKIGRAHV